MRNSKAPSFTRLLRLLPLQLLPPLLLLFCTPAPKILDYVSLPPPDHVRAKIINGQIEVTWHIPQLPSAGHVAGFNVYLSYKSLIYTALSDLPEPARMTTSETTKVLLPIQNKIKTVFIHARSTNKNGDVSLPSLPEIRLKVSENANAGRK